MYPAGTIPAENSRELKLSARDRRRRVRQKVHTPAYASLNGTSAGMALDLNEISDISEEGMSIQTPSPLEVNSRGNLGLDLSETGAYIHTSGQVIWSDRSGRAGIHFQAMPNAYRRRLEEWLFVNAITCYVNHAAPPTPQPEAQKVQEEPKQRSTPHAPRVGSGSGPSPSSL